MRHVRRLQREAAAAVVLTFDPRESAEAFADALVSDELLAQLDRESPEFGVGLLTWCLDQQDVEVECVCFRPVWERLLEDELGCGPEQDEAFPLRGSDRVGSL